MQSSFLLFRTHLLRIFPCLEGPIGMGFVINGANFGASGTVSFSGITLTPLSWTPTQITVQVPVGAVMGMNVVAVTVSPSNKTTFAQFAVDSPFSCSSQ